MKATISIVCHLALPQVQECICSIFHHQNQEQWDRTRLILTSNGNPEVERYFTELAGLGFVGKPGVYGLEKDRRIKVVVNATNQGFIEPNKFALSITNTELFIMLNDDAIVTKGWLDKIVEQFEKHPTASVVGPIGRRLRDNFVGGLQFTRTETPEYIEGCCFAVRTKWAKQHGLFDPQLQFAYGEEADHCLRMRQLGLTIHIADFTLIHHAGTTSRHVPEAKIHFDMNHAYLRDKWKEYLKTHKFPHE